jgi:proteasome assembly chaperone (PAC2) family protein
MKSINIKKRPRLKNPVMIAAWPGMGDVAIKAALYLKDKLGAVEFAELSCEEYFHPSGVWIDNSVISVPERPMGKFYFYKNPTGSQDVVIFISDAQPFLEKGYEYAKEIIDFALSFKVKLIYTFAAMPLPMEHTQTPQVYAAATQKETLDTFVKMNLKPIPTGQISGLNGLILGVAKEKGLDGVCLLGEIPIYTIQIENPLASIAVLSVTAKILNIKLDLTELQKYADQINQEIEHLIEYLKNPPEEQAERPIDQSEIDIFKKGLADLSSLPDSAKKKIEELFRSAKKDLSGAIELKRELDKWNIYEQYEDSFLDLFKKPPKKNN